MATWEHQLISRIVRSNDLNAVLQWGVTIDDFLTLEGRGLFGSIVSYFSMNHTRGSVLGEHAIRAYYPHFVLCDDLSMTTEALCVEVRKARLIIDAKEHTRQMLELLDRDPMAAISKWQTGARDLQNIGLGRNTDVHFHTSFDRAVQKAYLVSQGYDFSVARWLWQPLQRATMGLQADDYVVFYGRPKSMKSWCLSAVAASLHDQEKRLVIYTKEMTPDNIFQRIGCCLAGVDYDSFRHGNMTHAEWVAVTGTVKLLHFLHREQVVVCLNGSDAPKNGDTVDWLGSKVERYAPHAVLIDGMYLLSDSRGAKKTNERVANISRDLRSMILHTKTPVIATLQANRDAAKNTEANLDELAFSDAIGQDATLIIRVINEHKSGRETLALIVGGSRECHIQGFRIWGRPAVDFGDFAGGQELTSKDVENAVTNDTGDNDKAKKANGKKDTPNGKTEGENYRQAQIALRREVNGKAA